MSHSLGQKNAAPHAPLFPPTSATTNAAAPSVQPLAVAETREALAFLAARSVDTIFMSSLICDNGIASDLNRGTFYGCRNRQTGELEGIALIGHATLVEARTEAALASFARLARDARAHVIVGAQEKIESFWTLYEPGGQEPRRICRELFMEQRWPVETLIEAASLRLAAAGDLESLLVINARMACAESGVNPLEADPDGFRARLARRIEQERVWVWTEGERLLFKADLMAEVPGCIYLEGIYVSPDERGKGYGRRAMSQLGRQLLSSRTETLCLLVNEQNKGAQVFFFKAGYKLRACYDTIFLEARESSQY